MRIVPELGTLSRIAACVAKSTIRQTVAKRLDGHSALRPPDVEKPFLAGPARVIGPLPIGLVRLVPVDVVLLVGVGIEERTNQEVAVFPIFRKQFRVMHSRRNR